MYRAAGFFLLASAMAAQPQPGNPFDTLLQAYWTASREGSCQDAAAARAKVRNALSSLSPLEARFAGSVQMVAGMYQGAGRGLEARAIVEEALARVPAGSQTSAARALLLTQMADLWEQDHNLLKSVAFREQAVALLEAQPPSPPETDQPQAAKGQVIASARRAPGNFMPAESAMPVMRTAIYTNARGPFLMSGGFSALPNLQFAYQRLAQTYRQLGRPDKVAEVNTKIAGLLKDNPLALASWYQQEGRTEDAAALYKKSAEQPGDPDARANAWQALSSVYQNQQRFPEAAAALRSALGALEGSARPEAADRAIWMRQNLANVLNQAGDTQAADQVYAGLLADTQGRRNGMDAQILGGYTGYLAATKRGAQAETLLKQYLASHSGLSAPEQSNLLFQLASVARMSGQMEKAAEYQRAAEQKRETQPAGPATDTAEMRAMRTLQEAQQAANRGKKDEASELAADAISTASGSAAASRTVMQAANLAVGMSYGDAPEKGAQLFRRLADLAASCSVDSLEPLARVRHEYVRSMMDRQLWTEAGDALQAYRDVLIEGNGKESGTLVEALLLAVEAGRRRGAPQAAASAGRDRLAFEESLSGKTSEPYMEALQTMAELLEGTGDPEGALALFRQAIPIADLVYPSTDIRRGFVRARAASTMAAQRQFDEAERLVTEAIEIGNSARPSNVDGFRSQLEQIRSMKNSTGQRPQLWNGPAPRWFNPASPGTRP